MTIRFRFRNDDKILTATQSGYYRISGHSLDLHFDDDLIMIEKLNMKRPVTIVYYDGDKEAYFVKRFMLDEGDRKNHERRLTY